MTGIAIIVLLLAVIQLVALIRTTALSERISRLEQQRGNPMNSRRRRRI